METKRELNDILINDDDLQQQNRTKKLMMMVGVAIIILCILIAVIFVITRGEEDLSEKTIADNNSLTSMGSTLIQEPQNGGFVNVPIGNNTSNDDRFQQILDDIHDTHIRLALRNGASAICEKPLVLNPWNLDALLSAQNETNKHIYSILQLRLHPSILALKTRIEQSNKDCIFDIDLSYITARGKWYFHSWKGEESKSGGVATILRSNIGTICVIF